MRTSRFLNKALSLLALICLGFMQVAPVTTVSAVPLPRPALSIANACSGTALIVCIPDGSVAAFNDAIKVISSSGTTPEATDDSGTLVAHIGDTVHVPFAITDGPTCGQNIPAFTPSFQLNPLVAAFPITNITIVSPNPFNGLTYQDGVVGPTGSADTLYGYYEFVVTSSEAIPDGPGLGSYISFQLNVATWSCGSTPGAAQQINITGSSSRSARRVKVGGTNFTLTEGSGAPTHITVNNSVQIPVTLANIGVTSDFTVNASVAPASPAVPVSYQLAYPGGTTKDGQLTTNQSATGTITIGPLPQGIGTSITVTILAAGTATDGSGTANQQLVITLPVYQPSVNITITSDQPLYKPGDTATYFVTVTNSGQLTLQQFSVIDRLGGDLSAQFSGSIAPGGTAQVSFKHTILSSDANPLIDSATVSALWIPALPDTGSNIPVVNNTTYQVNVVSANVSLTFGPKSPTPNYAKPGVPITGTVVIANTGTQDITGIVTSVQLVDASDPTKTYLGALTPPVSGSLAAGVTVTPSFTVTLPTLTPPPTGVNLVITFSGTSSQGVVINKTLTTPLDVVLTAIHVIVTSDAVSGVVARGQVVTYTVQVQNISAAVVPAGTVVVTTDALNLLTTTVQVPQLGAAGDPTATFTVPAASIKTFTVTGKTTSPLVESVAATYNTSIVTGRLSLTVSDVQLTINNTPTCTVTVIGNNCSDPGSNSIVNNQVQVGQIVRLSVLIQNVGQSTVTSVNACQGNTTGCLPGDPNFLTLAYGGGTPGTLLTLGNPATAIYYLTIPAGATSPFVALITVSVKDQNSLQVLFRGTATLDIVSSNLYWNITKKASVASAFVGDPITYTVSACYNPDPKVSATAPASLSNIVASDPFIAGSHNVLLNTDGVGTPVATLPTLAKGHCATGTYTIIADDTLLVDNPGPFQLTNVVTFSSDLVGTLATQSVTVNLLNPLSVTKTVFPTSAQAGEPVTYTFSFTNLGSQPILSLAATDNLLPNVPFATTIPSSLNAKGAAGASFSFNYKTTAPAISGTSIKNVVNTFTATGTVQGVSDTASANAKLMVSPPLTITKTVTSTGPIYYYGPPITYTVVIKNTSSAKVRLKDVNDTIGGKSTPVVDKNISVTIGAGPNTAPLADLDIDPGSSVSFQYSALPADLTKLAGGPSFTNTVTVTAEVGTFGSSNSFTTFGTDSIVVYQPLYITSACPDFTYYGWSQVSHWHFAMSNGSQVSNPYALSNIKVTVNGLTGLSGLTLDNTSLPAPTVADFTARPKAKADFDWTIPWQTSLLNFNGVTFDITYTATSVGSSPKSVDFKYTIGMKEAGCYGDIVGPPLIVTKTPSAASAVVGDTITYTLTISNPMFDDPNIPPNNGVSSGSVTSVTAVDQTFAPSTNLKLVFSAPNQTIQPGQTASLLVPISHTVTGADPSPLINKVFVSGQLTGVTFPTPVVGIATVTLPNPLIVVTLTANPLNVNPGETISYDAVIRNDSDNNIQIIGVSSADISNGLPGVAENYIIGQSPAANLPNWLTAHSNGVILAHHSAPLTGTGLYQVKANIDPTKTGPYTSQLSVSYSILTSVPSPGVATASTTINVDNPNLRILLTTSPAIVVTYGQTIVYTEQIKNPGSSPDTNISVNHVLLAPNDAVGNWKDSSGKDLGAVLSLTYQLQQGDYITRTVTHAVTTIDNSPLTFVVTAQGQYTPACTQPCTPTPISVQDKKVSVVTISSAQLLLYANADKLNIAAGDNDNIALTLTNIGSVAITKLDVTATMSDISGTPYPDPITAITTVPIIPAIPGNNSPGNQLLPLAATAGNYLVKVPNPLPTSPAYPNPLIVTFTATGITAEGLTFSAVTTTLILHILQPNINIIETPRVAAVPVNGTVTYDVVVTNPGSVPLTVQQVVDNNNGKQPISLIFPGNNNPTQNGTLQTNESARGTTTAQVTNLTPNPYVHSSTATGQINGGTSVIDTSASTVNVLGSGLTAIYTASPQQGNIGSPTTFTVTVNNTSNITVNNLIATDVEHSATITLKDSKGNVITSLASNASATGVFTFIPGPPAGSFTEHVSITGLDATSTAVAASAAASYSVLGIGLAFSSPPTPDKLTAAVGDTVTFSFTLKNTATGSNNDLSNISIICVSSTCGALNPPLTSLAAGTTAAETMTYKVLPGDALGTGTVTLTFQATGAQASAPTNTTSITAIGKFNVSTGGVVVTKTANPTSGRPGDTIVYTVKVSNTNASPVTLTSLTDTLHGAVTLATGMTVAANGSATGTYNYVIPYGAPSTITNTVSASFTLASVPQTATATANVAVLSSTSGNMSVSVTPSVTAAKVGDLVTYTIAITNSGSTTINNLAGLSSLGITTGVTGTIPSGQTVYFTTTAYTIPIGATGAVTNLITITGTDTSGALSSSGSASVIVIGPSGLSVTKTASTNTATVGQTINYTIQIANYGVNDLTITGVTDSDPLASASALAGANGKLAAGTQAAPIVVSHTVTATDPAVIQDTVTVSATDASTTPSTPISDTASATVTNITSSNGLIISAVPNKTVASDGDILTYSVTVANVSSGLTKMTITKLAATFVLAGQTTTQPLNLLVNSLAPGAQTNATFFYTAVCTAKLCINPLVLQVAVSGTDVNNASYYASSSTQPVTVSSSLANGSYAASLSADQTNIPLAGSLINYTLTIINTGSQPLTAITPAFNGASNFAALFDPNPTGLVNVMFNRNAFNRPPSLMGGIIRPNAVILTHVSPNPFGGLATSLAPGASTSVTFSYTVQPTDGTVALVAAVDLTVTVNGVTTTTATPFSAVVQPTPESFTLSAPTSSCVAPCLVKPGDSIALTFTLTNTGSITLNNSNGKNPLKFTINGVTFQPASLPTDMKTGAIATLTYAYTVPATPPTSDPVALVISVTDSTTNVSASAAAYSYNVINASLTVSITSPALPATVADLSTVTFNFKVQNISVVIPGSPANSSDLAFNTGVTNIPKFTIISNTSGATIYTTSVALTDCNGTAVTVLAATKTACGTTSYTIKSSDPTSMSLIFAAIGCSPAATCGASGGFNVPAAAGGVVGASAVIGGQLSVTRATATPTITPTGTVTATGSTVCTSTNGLSVAQTASVTTVKPGDPITFTIKVTNGTGAGISGISLTDSLPTGFTAGTPTTDVGSAAVTGSSLTVAIGTLSAAQTANISLPATVGTSATSGTVTNTATVTVAGSSSSTPCAASVTITVANSASVLPVTGFNPTGPDNSALGGLLILGMLLSSVLVFGMAAGRNSRGGGNNNPLLLAGGLALILVIMLLLALIGVSLINKARTAPAATGTAAALNPTAIIVTLPGNAYVPPTRTPLGAPPTIAPTLTEVPPNTPIPSSTPIPTAAPPFQPVGERSFFMPRLQIPGGAVGLPITELPLVNSTWNVNSLGHIVGHLEQTSWLGTTGNTVLVAHIQLAYNDYGPFLRLGDAKLGDLVYVADHGQFYTYEVVDIKKVNPTDVQVTYATPNPILTLITCTTWDAQKGAFSQRLVVTAKLIKSPNYTA